MAISQHATFWKDGKELLIGPKEREWLNKIQRKEREAVKWGRKFLMPRKPISVKIEEMKIADRNRPEGYFSLKKLAHSILIGILSSMIAAVFLGFLYDFDSLAPKHLN